MSGEQETYDAQVGRFQRAINLGFGKETPMQVHDSHVSKSIRLPIVSASRDDSNVEVTWMGDIFNSTLLGVNLRQAIPATLLYPISHVFGDYTLSGHTNLDVAPPILNFDRAYHNQGPIQSFGSDVGPSSEGGVFRAGSVIAYLDLISGIDHKAVFDEVFNDRSIHGKLDHIDGGNFDDEVVARAIGLPVSREGYGEMIIRDETGIFERIKYATFGGVEFTMAEGEPLPNLTVPYDAVHLPTTEEMRELGLEGLIPVAAFSCRADQRGKRNELYGTGRVADQYVTRAELGERKFAIVTPNPLDSMLTALYLTKVVAPIVKMSRETAVSGV